MTLKIKIYQEIVGLVREYFDVQDSDKGVIIIKY